MSASSTKLAAHASPRALDSTAPGRTAQTRSDWSAWLLPGFAFACWALAIRHLSAEWTFNEQYHFGWLVPLLAAYLIKVRFESLPERNPPPTAQPANIAMLLLALASILIMPIREANLDWRLVEWALVPVAIAASLVCFWQLGGLPWVRHFSFPLLFFLIAVPLPRNLEYPWMDRLMLTNAHASVEILHWLGVDAQARGNLIQLPTCTLGVEEACSGIRSLQSTLMLSLFLGEILNLRWPRRLILLGAGLGWALITNIGRTTVLAWLASRDGLAAVDRWHDIAGFSVLALSSLTVAGTAWLLHRSSGRNARPVAAPSIDLSGLVSRFRPSSAIAGISILTLIAGLGLTRLWFDFHARSLTKVADWEFRLPTDQPLFREVPIAPQTQKTLQYNEGYSGLWKDPSGSQWQAYYFRWEAGKNNSQAARPHDPRSCLGGMGMELSAVLPSVNFAKGDVAISFDAFHFLDRGRDLYVFNCLAEDVRSEHDSRKLRQTNSPAERIAAALAGSRQTGQRRVEVAVWGAADATTAADSFRKLLNQQIHLASQPAVD